MAFDRFGRQAKRSYYSYGFCVKVTFVAIFGLCFVFIWSVFSSSSSSVVYQRSTFDDIAEPAASNGKFTDTRKHDPGKDHQNSGTKSRSPDPEKRGDSKINVSTSIPAGEKHSGNEEEKRKKVEFPKDVVENKNGSVGSETVEVENEENQQKEAEVDVKDEEEEEKEKGEEEEDDGSDKNVKADEELDGDGDDEPIGIESIDREEEDKESKTTWKEKKKKLGPLFDPRAHYKWKLCNARSKHNYIPCIDIESSSGKKLQIYRHHERSCPKASPPMCLVPLPRQGYSTPVNWPESKFKVKS